MMRSRMCRFGVRVTMPAVTLDNDAPDALPVRRRRGRRGGRHRGAESFALPADAPALVLAVPGTAGTSEVAADLALLTETAHTGRRVHLGHLADGSDALREALTAACAEHAAQAREVAARAQRHGSAPATLGDTPAAVIVPMLTGPHPDYDKLLHDAVATASDQVLLAQPLGPHPLLAQALHERLAESGLARADRIRMVSMVNVAGGVIVATAGGEAAARDAEVTGVLLASRLGLPVATASLDSLPTVADAAAGLLRNGATSVALAPSVLGPEVDPALLAAAAAEVDAGHAAVLGAHPALAQLIAVRYVEALEAALT